MTWRKGKKHTAETKAKISAAIIGKKLGPQSSEHRAKISAANLGKRLTDAHLAKLTAGHRAWRQRGAVA